MTIQNKASAMTLSQVLAQYGWEPLFRYQLLTPSQFATAYAKHVEQFPFCDLIQFYEKAKTELSFVKRVFPIPHPKEWKNKFLSETANMNCSEIASSYPIFKLESYDILQRDATQLLNRAHFAMSQYQNQIKDIEAEFRANTEPARNLLTRKEKDLRQKYNTSTLELEKRMLYRNYLDCNGGAHNFYAYLLYKRAKSCLDDQIAFYNSELQSGLTMAKDEFQTTILPFRDLKDRKIEASKEELKTIQNNLNISYFELSRNFIPL